MLFPDSSLNYPAIRISLLPATFWQKRLLPFRENRLPLPCRGRLRTYIYFKSCFRHYIFLEFSRPFEIGCSKKLYPIAHIKTGYGIRTLDNVGDDKGVDFGRLYLFQAFGDVFDLVFFEAFFFKVDNSLFGLQVLAGQNHLSILPCTCIDPARILSSDRDYISCSGPRTSDQKQTQAARITWTSSRDLFFPNIPTYLPAPERITLTRT